MSQPEAKTKILEDGDAALIEGSAEAEVVSEGEEFADLNTLKPEGEDLPAAKKPEPAPAPPVAKKPAAAAPAEEELPEDLKGKTPAQLAKMLKDAQSLIGRQGSELGEFRKKADMLIQASLANLAATRKPAEAAPAAPVEIDESEFFAKPKDAVSKLIENHPIIKEIRATLGKTAADSATARAAAATERFNAAHPDAQEILKDAEFRSWVGASKVRTQLMQRAHEKFDFDAGDEVFSTWKALKGVRPAPKPAADEAGEPAAAADGQPTEAEIKAAAQTLAKAKGAKQAAAQAAAASAAAAPTGGASAGKAAGTKKIYRRADVLRLMEEDPDRYEALSDELTRAYSEGRVR